VGTVFKGLKAIALKEFIHVLREPSTIVFALLIPVIQLTIFGYALDTDVKHIPTAVLDQSNTSVSRQLIDKFAATQYFDIVEYVYSDQALRNEIVSGRVHVGIKIAPDFSKNLNRGTGSQVLVLIDGSDSQVASRAQSAALSLGLQLSTQRITRGRSPEPLIDIRPRVLFNPDMRSANFFVPGLVGIIMQIVLMMLTALSIVREKEN
jgi:ABC-2 type transport system permease protein